MNMETGTGTGGTPFEYTVAEEKTPLLKAKRAVLIICYILWCGGLLILGSTLKLILPLLAFIPLSTWMLVFFTWRYTQVEYEYSFFSGQLTVSRILGGKRRRVLAEVRIKDLSSVLPYENEYVAQADAYQADISVFAASGQDAPDLYILLWQGEDKKRRLLCMNVNEKALKLLRYYNSSAVTVRKNG